MRIVYLSLASLWCCVAGLAFGIDELVLGLGMLVVATLHLIVAVLWRAR